MASKTAKNIVLAILVVLLIVGACLMIAMNTGNDDSEEDREKQIVIIAAAAIDEYVPEAEYTGADMIHATVFENPDKTATVHMEGAVSGESCRFIVMLESATPENIDTYSVYYVKAGKTIYLFEQTESTPKSEETESIENDIKEYLHENYSEFSILKLKAREDTLEVVFDLGVDPDNEPDNWAETKTSIEDIYDDIAEKCSENAIKNFVVYVDDINGNHLLTSINGKISYDAFGETTSSGANPPTISLAEFNQIATGMTYQEVTDIIGSAGEVTSEVDIFDDYEYFTQVRTWDGEGSIGANAVIEFQGGKVITKAQFGLE